MFLVTWRALIVTCATFKCVTKNVLEMLTWNDCADVECLKSQWLMWKGVLIWLKIVVSTSARFL
jgi:hypothetical protein